MQRTTAGGIKVLGDTGHERDGVGFAGTKGFAGGFGRGVWLFRYRSVDDFVGRSAPSLVGSSGIYANSNRRFGLAVAKTRDYDPAEASSAAASSL
jgi:hypothetical protein